MFNSYVELPEISHCILELQPSPRGQRSWIWTVNKTYKALGVPIIQCITGGDIPQYAHECKIIQLHVYIYIFIHTMINVLMDNYIYI